MNIRLTRRERETLVLIMLGLSTKEMAKRLMISHRTIDDYRAQLLEKYRVSDTRHLLYEVWK